MLKPIVRPAILALQGSVEPHHRALQRLGYGDAPMVRKPQHLESATHLILPGGESTTFHKLMLLYGLWEPIGERARRGDLAILGTCAGAILLGRDSDQRPPRWGLIDVEVQRNAYGTQLQSFVGRVALDPTRAGGVLARPTPRATPHDAKSTPHSERAIEHSMEGIFIRAPRFGEMADTVEVLGRLHDPSGEPVLIRQGRCVAATFHPELADEDRLHAWFLGL